MKAIIGVDSNEYTDEILGLLARLEFPSPQIELLNVVDATLPVLTGDLVGAAAASFIDTRRRLGESVLKEAEDSAEKLGFKAMTSQVYGPVTTTLMDHATEQNADLIAVRAALRGPLDSVVYGSVSRALAMGSKQSVLVVKGGHWKDGPVRAVIATDHSEYCNRAIEHFLQLHAGGIEKVCVMTAYQVDDEESHVLHINLAKLGGQVDNWIEEHLTEKTEAIAAKFTAAGIEAEARVVKGHANDAIRETMNDFGGELLILGAHGHGFLERLIIGSVALHQVVGEPYSTFLVRA
jgi:nucleotide-binding universal stress UspA family protein